MKHFPFEYKLDKGLSVNNRETLGNSGLSVCRNLQPTQQGLETIRSIPELVGLNIPQTNFPFPQFFELTDVCLICTDGKIFEYKNPTRPSNIFEVFSTTKTSGPWTVADFGLYLLLSNGECVVYKDAGTKNYVELTDFTTIPKSEVYANFNGQLIAGGVANSWEPLFMETPFVPEILKNIAKEISAEITTDVLAIQNPVMSTQGQVEDAQEWIVNQIKPQGQGVALTTPIVYFTKVKIAAAPALPVTIAGRPVYFEYGQVYNGSLYLVIRGTDINGKDWLYPFNYNIVTNTWTTGPGKQFETSFGSGSLLVSLLWNGKIYCRGTDDYSSPVYRDTDARKFTGVTAAPPVLYDNANWSVTFWGHTLTTVTVTFRIGIGSYLYTKAYIHTSPMPEGYVQPPGPVSYSSDVVTVAGNGTTQTYTVTFTFSGNPVLTGDFYFTFYMGNPSGLGDGFCMVGYNSTVAVTPANIAYRDTKILDLGVVPGEGPIVNFTGGLSCTVAGYGGSDGVNFVSLGNVTSGFVLPKYRYFWFRVSFSVYASSVYVSNVSVTAVWIWRQASIFNLTTQLWETWQPQLNYITKPISVGSQRYSLSNGSIYRGPVDLSTNAEVIGTPYPAFTSLGINSGVAFDTDGSYLYFVGGRNPAGTITARCWRFNIQTYEWTEIQQLPISLFGAVLVCHAGNLYIFGGTLTSGQTNTYVYRRKFNLADWEKLGSVSTDDLVGLTNFTKTIFDNRIFLLQSLSGLLKFTIQN